MVKHRPHVCLHVALVLAAPGPRVGVDGVILPGLYDLLAPLAGEQQLADESQRPVQEVAVTAVLPSTSHVPRLQ